MVGRDFLVFQGEPAVTVRKLARLVRPGGIIAFLEQELAYGQHCELKGAALRTAVDWLQKADRDAGKQLHVVSGFPRIFLEAGLGWPEVWAYQSAWGGEEGRQIWTQGMEAMATWSDPSERQGWDECAGGTWMMPPRAGAWARVRM